MDKKYLPRFLDHELAEALQYSPAVVIEGPRACGKTETATRAAESVIFLDDASPESSLARVEPQTALIGSTPRLLDEWQAAPGLWEEVRHKVDTRQQPGQFILAGSANPELAMRRHSGAGRFHRLTMSTLTLAEQGHSTETASLRSLFDGSIAPSTGTQASVRDYADWIVAGGWPGFLGLPPEHAQKRIRSYLADLVEHDFPQLAGNQRDPRRFQAFLRAYAGLIAQPASFAAISRRLGEVFTPGATPETVAAFHNFSSRLFVVDDQPPFSPVLRSAARPIQTPKRHLIDPSLAAVLLGADAKRLLTDLETLGFLFESLAVHDFRVYAQAAGIGQVRHFRDNKARDEIDLVIEGPNGSWMGFEVKLSHTAVDQAAANLLRVSAKISPAPTALAVIIPTGPVVQRRDGVWIIPLAACSP